MEGVLLIDKPVGPSSFDVVRRVRKLSRQKRVGHAGTLDPLASGLMVVCIGRYTKLAGLLTDANKVYETVVKLGVSTTTDDKEGEVTALKDCSHLSLADVLRAVQKFAGPIMQAPPRYSAIKINGQRAYALARAELDFSMKERAVEIFDLANLGLKADELSLRVHCSKGFYIRSLARDVGEALGVGAHAASIRRIKSGDFAVEDAVLLDDLTEENIGHKMLMSRLFAESHSVTVDDVECNKLRMGVNPLSHVRMQHDWAIAIHNDLPVAIMRACDGFAKIGRVI